jgi:glycosyltransferase involved in cell wall biosynthesis
MKHIAAFRMNAFVKYFDPEKFEITVIASNDSSSESETVFENARVYYLGGSTVLKIRKQTPGMPKWKHHLFSLNNKLIRFFSKSDYPGWVKNINSKLEELNASKKIDYLLTTFFPIDTHLAGLHFKQRNPSVCWIADMRDEMSQNALIDAKEKAYYVEMEKKIGQWVDVVTSVSQPIVDGFKIHMGTDRIKYLEVRNGFDHDLKPFEHFNEEFTFTYAGTFYGKRKPETFFKALSELNTEKKLPAGWKIQFLGTHHNFSIPSELRDHCIFLESVSNDKAIEILANSDCNLMVHPPSEAKGIFTGKLFDYLSVYRPILALVDKEDVAAELIDECKAGFNCDFNSIPEIKDAILEIIELWSNKRSLDFQTEQIQKSHRRDQVKKLEKLLLELK